MLIILSPAWLKSTSWSSHINVQGCLKRTDIMLIKHKVLFLCVYIMQYIHYSSNKCLLNALYILLIGTDLGFGDLAEGKVLSWSLLSWVGGGDR